MNILLIVLGKLVSLTSKIFNLGHGSTWPGHIALSMNKNFIKETLKKQKIVIIAGTNGKTTTAKLIKSILEESKIRVIHNEGGANLLNGIASALVKNATITGKLASGYAVFEVDENSLPLVLDQLTPDYLILLNLFRDQLDRYGEVDTVASKWKKAIEQLSNETIVILNADDPQMTSLCHPERPRAYRGGVERSRHIFYFGLNDKNLHQKNLQHAVDSTFCPQCENKLTYHTVYFSHLGDWECNNCGNKRPRLDMSFSPIYPLVGLYNRYNTHAAVLFAKLNNISNEIIEQSLRSFSPAFGRQEIIEIEGKRVQIFLSKNPTSFNESLRTIIEQKAQHLLIVLNDRIPDGRDVSWIWDVDFEELAGKKIKITISGDRCYDLGLRIKYASSSQIQNSQPKAGRPLAENFKFQIEENLKNAIAVAADQMPKTEILYILPTYSAMLEVRKILTGRGIL